MGTFGRISLNILHCKARAFPSVYGYALVGHFYSANIRACALMSMHNIQSGCEYLTEFYRILRKILPYLHVNNNSATYSTLVTKDVARYILRLIVLDHAAQEPISSQRLLRCLRAEGLKSKTRVLIIVNILDFVILYALPAGLNFVCDNPIP